MNSKIGNLTRSHPDFEPGCAVAEAAQLIKLGDAGGFQKQGLTTMSKTDF
jgi:hypothetical protein